MGCVLKFMLIAHELGAVIGHGREVQVIYLGLLSAQCDVETAVAEVGNRQRRQRLWICTRCSGCSLAAARGKERSNLPRGTNGEHAERILVCVINMV
jgi:hypothetical protein